jgi:hypothetical protein
MKLLKTLALSSAFIIVPSSAFAALDTSGADWVATVADNYVDAGPASESLSMVDFLLCVMEKSNAPNHVNETYGSMIDENACNGVTASSPSFATQVMTTSRVSNTSPMTFKSWFVTAEGMNVVVNGSITSAPTAAVPRGVLTMKWNMVNANGVGTGLGKGVLALNADNTISYIEHMPNENTNVILVSYVHGTLDGEGTSGRLRVQTNDWGTVVAGEPTDRVYQYVFNADSAHYKTGSTSTCLDRRVANMDKRVYGYKLFTEAGALKSLSGPFDFKYVDPQDASEKRGWADMYGVWLQGGEDDIGGNSRPTTITRNSNGKAYTVCWDDDDDGSGSCGTADDRIRYQMTHASDGVYTFEAPIKMVAANITDAITNAAVIPAVAWAREDSDWQFATYRGGVSHFDLPWQCMLDPTDDPTDDLSWTTEANNGNCNGKEKWRQKYALADGFEFTEQGTGTKYYAKAVDTKMTLAARADTAASCTNVSALALSTAPAALGAYTVPDITGDVIWGTGGAGVPSVANGGLTAALEMKVIHGVEQ